MVKSTVLISLIEKDGWYLVRNKGSHHHFKHLSKKGVVTYPHPKKDIPKGTVNSIFTQAGLK
ncbi:MAG TPA: type II toxin-antitoxin system HicA family toxin [Salegentibacter sp.]|uniref:type II toxin-antitoxin system HicA family toxin n=1 Tax=Salegentibacter sp. TaxID=1903072 RepID=UPI002F958066